MKAPLSRIAHTRSGDKGDTCNIGVVAYDPANTPSWSAKSPPNALPALRPAW